MMMIPEAFGPSYHISTDKRAFYEYHAAIMEPWDGPAAILVTDGILGAAHSTETDSARHVTLLRPTVCSYWAAKSEW